VSPLVLLFEQYADIHPEPGYWFETEDGGDGDDYCLKCVKEKDAGRGKYSGYGCSSEHDGCLHCSKCGKLLDYVLTDYGAEEELNHFRAVKFRRNKPLDRETAYHLARLIAAKEGDLEVIWIAARAIRCMKRIPAALPSHKREGE
jgi:hypothetical protein